MENKNNLENHIKAVHDLQDKSAFEHIYNEYVDKIYNFIKYKYSNQNVCEDILQEVFIKTWNGIPKLNLEETNFNAWIYTVARNTINDYHRKDYRTPTMTDIEEATNVASTNSATDLLFSNEAKATISSNLELLPPDYKEVIELRFIEEFSIKETAKIMNKTNVSVRLLQHRAIKKLKTILQQ